MVNVKCLVPTALEKNDLAPDHFCVYLDAMAYQVFARKYRPPSFEDVVAQAHVTRTLQNSVKNDRVGSGYLFTGPRGTGKTTTARILAKALNCVNGPTPAPCGECPACRDITAGSSLDVLEIDAASNTGVDDVRALRERINLTPAGGKKKIYIIDEVHRLSGAAFDALLKTLEEPPEHVVFVFATTEPTKVPETILSRTQRFDFKRVSALDLAAHLKDIAAREGIVIEDTALALLARRADGSVRDSLSLLDQVAAFAGDDIHEQEVVEALGLVDRQTLFDFCEAVAAQDAKKALLLVKNVLESGVDVQDFLEELLDHFRILMILAADRESTDLISLGADEYQEYLKQTEYFTMGDIMRLMKTTGDALGDLKSGLDERLVLEVSAVRMATMESTVSFQQVLAHLQQNPRATAGSGEDLFGGSKKKAEPVSTGGAVPDKPGAEPVDLTRKVNLPQIQSGWDGFLAELRRKSPMLSSQLGLAEIREVNDNKIFLVFGANGAASLQLVRRPENMKALTETLRGHFHANIGISVDIDPARPGRSSGHNGKELNRAAVEKMIAASPRLQKLVEKVDGEIIGVKKVK